MITNQLCSLDLLVIYHFVYITDPLFDFKIFPSVVFVNVELNTLLIKTNSVSVFVICAMYYLLAYECIVYYNIV